MNAEAATRPAAPAPVAPAVQAEPVVVSLGDDPALFAHLASTWAALLDASDDDASLFLTPAYLQSYLDTFTDKRYLLALARRGSRPVAAACFVLEERGGRSVLRPAGEGLWGYTGVVSAGANDAEAVAAVLRAALQHTRAQELELGPLHPSRLQLHVSAARRLGTAPQLLKIPGGAPFIDTRVDLAEWRRSRKKAASADAERCEKRLSEAGRLSIAKLSNADLDAAAVRTAMAGFLVMYHRQWPQNRFLKDPRWLAFYERFALAAARDGLLEFAFLTLDGRPLAAHYGFVHKRRRYYFTPTYDVAHGRFSPGKVLLNHLVKASFAAGETFDFQNDLEPYKLDWATGVADRFLLRLATT